VEDKNDVQLVHLARVTRICPFRMEQEEGKVIYQVFTIYRMEFGYQIAWLGNTPCNTSILGLLIQNIVPVITLSTLAG